MTKDSMDFLREALQALVEGIIACPVPRHGGRRGFDADRGSDQRAQRGASDPPQRLPQPGLGHPGGHHGTAHSEDQGGQLLPSARGRLEPRRRSEKALLAVIQQAYVGGVSTRRVDDLIKSLGCGGISRSQVSRICRDLDQVVENFLGRPLDDGPYPYVWLDALTQKVREGGRIVNVSVVVATGVNAHGQREVLGMDVGASEDGAFWLSFLR